jgi:DNA modification methylase
LAAAVQLGLAEVPTIRLEGLDDQQRRALTLADNKLAMNAGWDEKLLVAELQGLGDLQGLVGFSQDELMRLLGGHDGLTDPDEVPPEPANPVTRPGDLWLLGPHRLFCGSATVASDVTAALDGVVPHLMVTDPPYGVEFDPTWRKGSEKRTYMGGDPDMESVWEDAWRLFPGDVAYIWHAHSKTKNLWIALEALGFEIRQPIIWNKMRFIIGRGNYCFNHEACFYGVRKGGEAHWQGARDQPTVWDIPHRASDTNHGAQKPLECMRRPIENSSQVGDHIYEPFSGSGTTLIAAEMMQRVCHAIELNPVYCDVAVTRWEKFTGQKAERRPAQNADAA